MRRTFLCLIAATLLSCNGGGGGGANPNPTTPTPQPVAKVNGGSNYILYDVGNGTGDETLRPVIGTYHLAPDRVKQQIANLFANSQKRITLFLWFKAFDSPDQGKAGIPDVDRINVNSAGGKLSDQSTKNLVAILKLINDTRFYEMNFRFAQQGVSDPTNWKTWDEAKYQENLAFIKSVRNTVAGNVKIPVIYDLGVELAGRATYPQVIPYCNKLWQDYIAVYGAKDSYGFSVNSFAIYLTDMIKGFKSVKATLPRFYALDVYGNETLRLNQFWTAMKGQGEGDKEIIVQEVFYNDAKVADQIKAFKNQGGMRFRTIYQWPHIKGQSGWAHTPYYTPNFWNYVGL